MNPHALAAQLRARPGFNPSSRTGSVVILLELLPEDATTAQVDEVTAGLLPAGPAAAAGFAEVVTVPDWVLVAACTGNTDRVEMEV